MSTWRAHTIGCLSFVIAVLGCSEGRSCDPSGPETSPPEEAIPGATTRVSGHSGNDASAGVTSPRTLTLWLGGDVHLGATRGDGLAPLASELAGAPGIVNLEGPVGPDAAASTAERLVNDRDALAMLAQHHVAVAGIANNHAGDLGPAGISATRRALEALDITPVGAPGDADDGGDPGDGVAVIERHGLRVAISAHDLSAGVPAGLPDALARARTRGDALVAWFHVLAPPLYTRRPELRQAVQIALDAGATIVAAHGSHAIARVERRDDAVILWGLGNLLFDCECSRETEGLLARIELERDDSSNDPGVRVGAAQVIPIDAGLSGEPARMAAEPEVTLDVLESLGSTPLRRTGDRAFF